MPVNVSIVPCPDYSSENVRRALSAALEPLGGLDWVEPGMTVAIKTNLVSRMKPESAAVTHPALLAALTEELRARERASSSATAPAVRGRPRGCARSITAPVYTALFYVFYEFCQDSLLQFAQNVVTWS